MSISALEPRLISFTSDYKLKQSSVKQFIYFYQTIYRLFIFIEWSINYNNLLPFINDIVFPYWVYVYFNTMHILLFLKVIAIGNRDIYEVTLSLNLYPT